jgi:hypothetical protein
VPILASSLPLITEAHAGVLPLVKPPQTGRLAEIMNLEAEIDIRHDSIIRGTYGTLTTMAELVGGDDGTALIALRDELIPDGQQSMLKSYRAEATQADQLDDRLTPKLRARTDAILIGEAPNAKPLTALLDEWIVLGKQLGALEDEKGRIEAAAGEAVSGAVFLKARNFWVRVVNALVANAELADIDADKRATIFGPFWNAEKKADERARQSAAKGRMKAAAAEQAAAEKAAAEKAAAEKAAAEKAAAEKASQGSG